MNESYDFLIDVRDVLSKGISRHATACASDVVTDLVNAHHRVLLLAESHQADQVRAISELAGVTLIFSPYAEYFARFDESVVRLINQRYQVRHSHSFAQFLDPRIGRPRTFSATIYDLTRLHFGKSSLFADNEFLERLGRREFTNMKQAIAYMRTRVTVRPGHVETLMEDYIRLHAQYILEMANFVCVPSTEVVNDIARYFAFTPNAKIVLQEPTRFPSFFIESREACRSRIGKLRIPSKFILFVGTPDWHKRLDLVLDYLAAADGDEDLALTNLPIVVAGDEAGADLFERLGGYTRNRRPILRVGDVTDHMLRALYSEAYFTVVPSMAEGYGLPLDEALLSGGTVVVSDLPVFRERVNNSRGRAIGYDPMSQKSFLDAARKVPEHIDSATHIPSIRESVVSNLLLSL